ncbi:MAG: YjjG family noncanonical pyrimidine nucleotidase [Eubacteriales bacterium]|nr:YjjG family noncanonical pyrimidine nucleotidase [Eubacteriales bacterium]
MKYRALFLDMDGTFLDFHAAEREAFDKAFGKTGKVPEKEHYLLYSRINDELWKAFERGEIEKEQIRNSRFGRLFEQLGISADGIAVERDYEIFLGEGHELIPHAREVLTFLAGRYPLYVTTNGFANVQRNRLKLAGIEGFMEQIFISEEIGYQKPKKEFFDACFSRIEPSVLPGEVLLIGDSLTSDILGAKNAGIASCWFNPERRKNESGIQPDYEIGSLLELKELLK